MGPGPIIEKMPVIYGIPATATKKRAKKREKHKNGAFPIF
jgi:hypothetical protein